MHSSTVSNTVATVDLNDSSCRPDCCFVVTQILTERIDDPVHTDCCFDVEEHYSDRVVDRPRSPHRRHRPKSCVALIERLTTSGSINLPIWRAPRAGPGSSQWISLNLNPSVRLVKHLLKVPTQKEASEGRSRRISGQPRPISAHLGQSRPISANLGQSRPTSADLGQSRPTSAYLGQPWPSSSTLGPRANHLGPRAQQPWPTRQSPISGRWRAHRVPSRHRLRQRPSRVRCHQ